MKRTLYILLLISMLIVLASTGVFATEKIIKINPNGFITNDTLIEVEKPINSDYSFVYGNQFYYSDNFSHTNIGLGGKIGYRNYVEGQAPEGLYYGPNLYLSHYRTYYDSDNLDVYDRFSTTLRVEEVGGYQWILGNNIVLDLNLGANFTLSMVNYEDGQKDAYLTKYLSTNINFGLGYAF